MNSIISQSCCRVAFAIIWMCLACGALAQQPPLTSQDSTNVFPLATTETNQIEPPPPLPQSSGPTIPGTGQLGSPSMGTSVLAGSPVSVSTSAISGPPIVSVGPIGVYPHLLYQFSYGNGIIASPGHNTTTAIDTISPGVLLSLGNHWTLNYTPALNFYSSSLFKNTVDQSVLLNGRATNGDWILGLSQSYVDSTQPLIETGLQTEEEMYATVLSAGAQLNSRFSVQLSLNQNFRFSPSYPGLHEWSTEDWLDYHIEPQLAFGLGPTVGYDELGFGSDMPFEDYRARIVFDPGSKLLLSVDGGLEDRQFIDPSAPSLITPVFDASLSYQVLLGTVISIAGSRAATPALFSNEVTVVTSVNGSIRQHLIKTTYLEIGAGYSSEPFTSIEPAPLPKYFFGTPPRSSTTEVRSDTTEFARISLSTTFRTRLTGSIFYFLSQNDSSQSDYSFKTTQVGAELNYQY